MLKNYPIIFKIILAFSLAIGALFVLTPLLKVILAFAAIIVFGLVFQRFRVTFIILVTIFVLLPFLVFLSMNMIGVYSSTNPFYYLMPYRIFSFERLFGGYYNDYPWRSGDKNRIFYPDKSIKAASNIQLNVEGLELVFDPNSTEIAIPSKLVAIRNEDSLKVSLPNAFYANTTFVVKIGTKNKYNTLSVHSNGISVRGMVKERMNNITINSNGLALKGFLNAKFISIDCNGGKFDGEIKANTVRINANGSMLHLSLNDVEKFSMNCTSVIGEISYLDKWSGTRFFSLNGDAGVITVKMPKNTGKLEMSTSGIHVKVVKF